MTLGQALEAMAMPKWDKYAEISACQRICEICAALYATGHCSGTGGGACIRIAPNVAVVAPSGVQKERLRPADMFIVQVASNDKEPSVVSVPASGSLKVSECTPLFNAIFVERPTAFAAIHSHSIHAVMAMMLLAPGASELVITHMEMIKGIAGHGFHDDLIIPVIENTAHECQLTMRLRAAIKAFPRTQAVLVRRHGIYVWGNSWEQAKTQLECYTFLFEAMVRSRALGVRLDVRPTPASIVSKTADPLNWSQPRAIILDIDGTITSSEFVKDTLMRYFDEHVDPSHIAAVDASSLEMRSLQARVWAEGYKSGELRGHIYDDVPTALRWWTRALKIDVCLYSRGAIAAQELLLKHSVHGDISSMVARCFDQSTRGTENKNEEDSYRKLAEELGVPASEVVYATDSLTEAKAASRAGFREAILLDRRGDDTLKEQVQFRCIKTLLEIL